MKEFYVGQDVVAITTHDEGFYKEGDIFVVKGLKQGCCKRCPLDIDIGQITEFGTVCHYCDYDEETTIRWFNANNFRPLDELTNISELTEILENTKPFEINK